MVTYIQIQETHELYCTLTGLPITFQLSQMYAWELFRSRFSDDDLKLVIRFIKDKLKDHKPARSFTFRNFISGPNSLDFFEEDLCEARARYRTKPTDPERVSVLKATGRAVSPEKPPMTVVEVMKEHETMAMLLKQFKEAL